MNEAEITTKKEEVTEKPETKIEDESSSDEEHGHDHKHEHGDHDHHHHDEKGGEHKVNLFYSRSD